LKALRFTFAHMPIPLRLLAPLLLLSASLITQAQSELRTGTYDSDCGGVTFGLAARSGAESRAKLIIRLRS
jgi:hypothetical protein